MDTLIGLAKRVEQYDKEHRSLHASHHYVFACPLPPDAASFDYVVMGLNPGEQVWNWTKRGQRTSETVLYDWILELPHFPRANKWRRDISTFCSGRSVLMSELFFWSSANAGAAFEDRFGTSLHQSPHLGFCRDMNLRMIEVAKPKAVILPGLSLARQFGKTYELVERREGEIHADNGHVLVKVFEGYGVPWLFTKHWSGSFGFSAKQRQQVRDAIATIA